ncbi:hypothetical protein PSA7680_02986 [Pseudoruegeria aquimaris]|uniref:Excalibur calcium-binding domain-containing protein n=1 Tax=Pseudoruegeria aquimaris TaxID=393663 RepID=A0A1Y5TC73_9RHOB|nr:hypothetical protein [Pseudoruegeria aquimaris]SLN57120.1 hypothetical protein PSA7680_02986 [Pseudoruegeria aquimaris]
MRAAAPIIALVALAACEPTIPDSGAGVGFNDYAAYQQERARREAELTGGTPLPSARAISSETPAQAGAPLSALNAQGQATVTPTAGTAAIRGAPVATSALSEAPVAPVTPGTAPAVAAAGTAAPAAPAAAPVQRLPETNSDGSPNVVAYALNTTNSVGQSLYPRDGSVSAERLQRNCAKYGTSDQAQAAFLKAGGPQKDRYDIDPDGDGFACYWNPAPFRAARGG